MKLTKFADMPLFTIAGYGIDCSLPYLITGVDNNVAERNLQMCPDFQRGHVWSAEQQVAIVEFLLRGGRSGKKVYFNSPSWMAWGEL